MGTKGLSNFMEGSTTTTWRNENDKEQTPVEVLNEGEIGSFSNFLIHSVAKISPRSMHCLPGRDSNQHEISAQFFARLPVKGVRGGSLETHERGGVPFLVF